MLKRKILTISTATVMSFTSLGLTAFTVHADTKKEGDTVVSYTAPAPKPKDWGISVPASVELNKEEGVSTSISNDPRRTVTVMLPAEYGEGQLSIVDADGKTFADPSKDRTFTVSATSADTDGENNDWVLKAKDGTLATLLVNKQNVDMGLKFYQPSDNNPCNFNYVSNANGKGSVVSSTVTFAATLQTFDKGSQYKKIQGMDRNKNYSDTISWTAKETTGQ